MSEPGKNIINDTILSSAQSGDNKQTEALISNIEMLLKQLPQSTSILLLNMTTLFRRA